MQIYVAYNATFEWQIRLMLLMTLIKVDLPKLQSSMPGARNSLTIPQPLIR